MKSKKIDKNRKLWVVVFFIIIIGIVFFVLNRLKTKKIPDQIIKNVLNECVSKNIRVLLSEDAKKISVEFLGTGEIKKVYDINTDSELKDIWSNQFSYFSIENKFIYDNKCDYLLFLRSYDPPDNMGAEDLFVYSLKSDKFIELEGINPEWVEGKIFLPSYSASGKIISERFITVEEIEKQIKLGKESI
ncbi:MAG: hypothetical protein PHX34_01700 [Candidatus Shapirobacteria bacterium]|nr:hypothetical protein [Candidatus Shapirobacteria bacterium]